MHVESYGEVLPARINVFPDGRDNPEGRAKNRRVEFIPYSKGDTLVPLADPLKGPVVYLAQQVMDTLSRSYWTVKVYEGRRKPVLGYFAGMKPVIEVRTANGYVYYSGLFAERDAAETYQKHLAQMGVVQPQVVQLQKNQKQIVHREPRAAPKE